MTELHTFMSASVCMWPHETFFPHLLLRHVLLSNSLTKTSRRRHLWRPLIRRQRERLRALLKKKGGITDREEAASMPLQAASVIKIKSRGRVYEPRRHRAKDDPDI